MGTHGIGPANSAIHMVNMARAASAQEGGRKYVPFSFMDQGVSRYLKNKDLLKTKRDNVERLQTRFNQAVRLIYEGGDIGGMTGAVGPEMQGRFDRANELGELLFNETGIQHIPLKPDIENKGTGYTPGTGTPGTLRGQQ